MGDALQPEPVIIAVHEHEGRRQIEVQQAPPLALITDVMLLDIEYGCTRDATFDGEVLTLWAINGTFRYRVDRRQTAESLWRSEFPIHRVDEDEYRQHALKRGLLSANDVRRLSGRPPSASVIRNGNHSA